jgi:hypothetical protein
VVPDESPLIRQSEPWDASESVGDGLLAGADGTSTGEARAEHPLLKLARLSEPRRHGHRAPV